MRGSLCLKSNQACCFLDALRILAAAIARSKYKVNLKLKYNLQKTKIMDAITIAEAAQKLPDLIAAALRGEEVIISDGDRSFIYSKFLLSTIYAIALSTTFKASFCCARSLCFTISK